MAYNPNLFSNALVRNNYLGIDPPGLQYLQSVGAGRATNLGARNVPAPPTYSDATGAVYSLTTPSDISQLSAIPWNLAVPTDRVARLTPGGLPSPDNAPTLLRALNYGNDGAHNDGLAGDGIFAAPEQQNAPQRSTR